MNEALKLDEVTQRSAPAPVETAPRRAGGTGCCGSRLSRLCRRGGLCLAEAACLSPSPSTNRDEGSGKPAQLPQTVRVAPVTLGDTPDHRRLGNSHAVRDRHHPHPNCRHVAEGRLHRRPDGQGRLPTRPDRSAAVRGGARPGAGAIGQGPGATGARRRATSPAFSSSPNRI